VFQLVHALLSAQFMPVSGLVLSPILKMKATCSSETSVDFQWTARRCIPEDRNFNITRTITVKEKYF
jgi:hypothetical protein